MRILVCGGRYYNDVATLWLVLDQLRDVAVVIDGASDDVTGPYVGADYWAHQWANAHDKETIRCHAYWKAEGRAAGPNRNARMLAEHTPDLVVAFPGGAGTADMLRRARLHGVPIEDIATKRLDRKAHSASDQPGRSGANK